MQYRVIQVLLFSSFIFFLQLDKNFSDEVNHASIDNSTIDIIASTVNPSCNSFNGDADGAIYITVDGGIAPYTYNWQGTNVITTDKDQNNLTAGNYSVTVTDATGESTILGFDLTEPQIISILAATKDLDCEEDNGEISVVVVGGNPGNYIFDWSGPGVEDSDTPFLTNLSAGTYTLLVTDNNGCTQSDQYTLTQLRPINVSSHEIHPVCLQGGSIELFVEGGTGNYSYSWEGPGVDPISMNQENLSEGSFNVTITDELGCTVTSDFWLRDQPVSQEHQLFELCKDDLPYEFEDILITEEGNWLYILEDDNGCKYELFLEVHILSPPRVTTEVTITEDELPYIWFGREIFKAGKYYSTQQDVNGCSYDEELILTVSQGTTTSTGELNQVALKVYPNPVSEYLYVQTDIDMNMALYSARGKRIHVQQIQSGNNELDVSNLEGGLYFLNLSTETETVTKKITIR